MANKDRGGHNTKRAAARTPKEKRQAKREKKQSRKGLLADR